MRKPHERPVDRPAGEPRGASSPVFLLAQVGAHAAGQFAARLEPLGLVPAHAGILRLIHASEGLSQQALGAELNVLPSRLVVLIDDLERRGLVERRDHPSDRRSHALYLSPKGKDALKAIGRVAREHQAALCAGLNDEEREQLARLLRRIADHQGLRPGVHPGYSRMRAP